MGEHLEELIKDDKFAIGDASNFKAHIKPRVKHNAYFDTDHLKKKKKLFLYMIGFLNVSFISQRSDSFILQDMVRGIIHSAPCS